MELEYKLAFAQKEREDEERAFTQKMEREMALVSLQHASNDPMTSARFQRFATQCLVCAHPLCDAKSVECGIGPTCRERIGMKAGAENLAKLNALTAKAAMLAEAGVIDAVLEIAQEAKTLGYPKVSQAIYARFIDIRIQRENGNLLVQAPFDDKWNEAMRGLGRWDASRKCRVVPTTRKQELWSALKSVFSGRQGLAPDDSIFVIA